MRSVLCIGLLQKISTVISIKLKDRKFKVCSLLSFVSDNFAQSYTQSETVLSRTFDKAEDKVEYRVDKKEVDNTDED